MRMLNRLALAASFVAFLGFVAPPAGTRTFVPRTMAVPAETLLAAPGNLNYAYGPQGDALAQLTAGDRPASATFVVTYDAGFNANAPAKAAFQAAVNIWSATITSAVPIRVNASFASLGANVLGSAGATNYCLVPAGLANTYYPAPLADKINGSAFCGFGGAEIDAQFSSTRSDWDFGTTGVGVPNKYNFLTVVLHEIGHGLGVAGAFSSSGGIGNLCCGFPQPSIYDRFAASGGGTLLVNIARPSAALHNQLVSNNTFWVGPLGNGAKLETHNFDTTYGINTGTNVGFQQGSSYSHIDDILYSGTPNGLMTFQLAANEVYTDAGPVVRNILTDEGWTVGSPPPPTPRVFGDFDGNGTADLAVFRPAGGLWFVQGQTSPQFGVPGDIPVPGDYDGNGTTDIAVYRPSTGEWFVRNGTPATTQWGRAGDIPVPADYDNDKKTDAAVYRTTDNNFGVWYINVAGQVPRSWGVRGDVPMAGDYDGDGRGDLAVYRPSTGTWFISFSSTGFTTNTAVSWGLPGDVPVRGDFDNDAKLDFVVFRPSTGTWYLSLSTGTTSTIPGFGSSGDIPIGLDIDGDGRAEACVWRPSTGQWFMFNRVTSVTTTAAFGIPGDIPAASHPRLPSALSSDFDGDGRSEITVFRPSTGVWYTKYSSTGFVGTATPQWGLSSDIRVPGDYDGDHRTDLAVFRPASGEWYIFQSSTASLRLVQWGLNSDIPVPADYDGDGRTDIAVFRPSSGQWYILNSSTGFRLDQFGLSGDKPVAADFDGDGRADLAVFRPASGTWFLKMSTTPYGATITRQWGLSSDIPVASDYDGDGRAELTIYRPSTGQWLGLDALLGTQTVSQQWGLNGDTPNPHDYDGDGRSDKVVFRSPSGEWFVLQSSTGTLLYVPWGLPSDLPVESGPGGFDR